MSKSIRISPKYGVNPTIPVCFFCGEAKNEIALMGKVGGKGEDIEMPMHCVLDYEPCDKCKEEMAQGITLIGVAEQPTSENQTPIDANRRLYPTGKWCVITEECTKRIFDESSSKSLLDSRKGFIAQEVMDMIMPDKEQ